MDWTALWWHLFLWGRWFFVWGVLLEVAALAAVFGVAPSYLLDRGEPLFDGELVEALRDKTIRAITRETSRLPDREMGQVLGIVR